MQRSTSIRTVLQDIAGNPKLSWRYAKIMICFVIVVVPTVYCFYVVFSLLFKPLFHL